MSSLIAYIALLAWPPVAIVLFRAMPIERALIWAILAPYLLLPEITNFDFPLVPPLDKVSIPNISALFAVTFVLGHRVPLLTGSPLVKLLMALFVVSPVATVLTNTEPYVTGLHVLPGQQIHDALSAVINQAIFILPFFLARRFLATETALRELLLALVVAMLVYSLPILFEIRFSPQLHRWIYGFHQHTFLQMIRFGGYRPMVFTPHGIWLAFTLMTAVLAAAALWRASPKGMRGRFLFATAYLFTILVLSKSLAALVYAVALLPMVFLLGGRLQIYIAAVFAILTIAYPILRGADLVPVEAMLEQAREVSADRAQSLGFRFEHEKMLLDHANEKPVFGWGLWGRNNLYDPVTGEQLTVTDGRWIIVIGMFGWLGYIVEFGLLALPLLMMARHARRMRGEGISPYAGPLALILGINMIELLPNATLSAFSWLLAGSLLGYAEALRAGRSTGQMRETAVARPTSAPRRTIL